MLKLNVKCDVLRIPAQEEAFIIASDNSGAIGEKDLDDVRVPYEMVAYFAFRVSYMECMAAGATPFSIIVHNFNGDAAWDKLISGIYKGLTELELLHMPITGSSESNFTMQQSATGISLVGRQQVHEYRKWENNLTKQLDIAVIGKPLVGPEVVTYSDDVASLKMFKWLNEQEEVLALIPVGSKGIQAEIKKIHPDLEVTFPDGLDVKKSAGPATCYIAVYKKEFRTKIQNDIHHSICIGSW